MDFNELDIPKDFIFDIASIPGSSDEVCKKTIQHYKKQLSKTTLHPKLREIAAIIIDDLTKYYQMANFDSDNLRNILPHLSECARFMEDKTSVDIDVESSGRIKSFYSEYVKIIDKIADYIEKDIPFEKYNFIEDTWATRDVLHPRHDMKYDTKAFFKRTYSLILDFMEHIDDLSKKDPRFGFKEFEKHRLLELQRPKKFTCPEDKMNPIPEKDFLDYAFEIKNLQEGFKYLPDLSDNISLETLKLNILVLQAYSDDILRDNPSSLMQKVISQVKFEQLVMHRNNMEQELISTFPKNILEQYRALQINEFWEEYKHNLNAQQRDKLRYLSHLNKRISDTSNKEIKLPTSETGFFSSPAFRKTLDKLKSVQLDTINYRLSKIKELDLSNFEEDYDMAQKLKRFSRCAKDYMRYPRKTGYQAFHMIVNTPYGSYEKQIRTEAQDDFAERGHASHSNTYKPDIRSTFHRLKVSTPFMPKRDKNGDIIQPLELGLLPFELAVYSYYKQPFSNFSGGKTLAQFKSEYSKKDEFGKEYFDKGAFDKGMLELSPSKVSQGLLTKIWNKLFPKKEPYTPKVATQNPTITASYYSDVPEDISAYPNIPDAPKKNSTYSTDDSDPHSDGNR